MRFVARSGVFFATLSACVFQSAYLSRLMSAEVQSITVVSYPARPAKLPLWLAQDAGLFEKQGLRVTIKELASSEEMVEAIRRGEGQIYAATANWIVSAIGDGADLIFFANTRLQRSQICRPAEYNKAGRTERKESRHRRGQ